MTMWWNAYALVVEPPVPVANTLLEEARRLAKRFEDAEEVGGKVTWMRPHRYAAPLVISERLEGNVGDAGFLTDPLERATERLVRGREEFAVQMGPACLDPCANGTLIVSRLSAARNEDILSLLDDASRTLGNLGMCVVDASMIRIALGWIRGAGHDRLSRLLDPTPSGPISGWLLGGVCLARALVDPDAGLLEAERIRFLPLKRMGALR